MTENSGGRKQTGLLNAEFVSSVERLTLAQGARPAPSERHRTTSPAIALLERYERHKMDMALAGGSDHSHLSYPGLSQLFRLIFDSTATRPLHLLIDSSQSMLYDGNPDPDPTTRTKFDFARKIAAAAGYVALTRGRRVQVAGFAQYRGGRAPSLFGRDDIDILLALLQKLRAGGNANFTPTLQKYVARAAAPGICVVISDFYDNNWRNGLRALLSARLDVILLHVLTPTELAPDLLAELRLVNGATGIARDLAPDSGLRRSHRTAIEEFCQHLEYQAMINGMSYVRETTEAPVEHLLLNSLHSAGALRG